MPDIKYAWVIINKGIGAWPPSAMDEMSLEDFYDWYDIAIEIIDKSNEEVG